MGGKSTRGEAASRGGAFSRDLKPLGAGVRPAGAAVPLAGAIPERSFRVLELGALIPRLTRPAFRRRSPEAAMLLADWPMLAGPALAAMAEPVRLSAGTLTLACTGPAAMELSLMAPVIIERLNGALGRKAVLRLAFVQRHPRIAAPGPRRRAPAAGPVPESARTLPEGDLQAALVRLGRGVAARGD